MTQPDDPLNALWAADEPPARDHAFAAAAVARATAQDQPYRADWPRRLLTGFGLAGALAGAVLLTRVAPADPVSMALVGAALTAAVWVGGRLYRPV